MIRKLLGAARASRSMGVLAAGAAAMCMMNAEPAEAQVGRYAVHFNNAGAIVASPNDVPTGSSAYTVEAWIRAEVMGGHGIVGWGNYGVNNQTNALRLDGSNGGGVHNYWWNNDLTAITGAITNVWHHVAATWDGTSHRIYVDGTLYISRTNPTPPNVQLGNFAIGKTYLTEYFQGDIAEVRIWNVARTSAEISSNMNATLAGNETGLVSLYRLEEGSGATTSDAAGANFVGTLDPGLSWIDLTPPNGVLAGSGSFGTVANGSSSAAQTFTLSNVGGSGSLIVNDVNFTGTDASLFTLGTATVNPCNAAPFTLAVGDSCNLAVSFAPPAATSSGSKSASLNVIANNPTALSAALSGTVSTTSSLVLAYAGGFAATVVNATSPEATFTLTNDGSTQVNGISASVSGADASMFDITGGTCGSTLTPGQSCTYTMTFSPTGTVTAATVKSATLNVTTSNTAANTTLTLEGLTGATIQQIPTLSEWGMIALGLMLAGSMLVATRKRDESAG